jgi:hypothetical protein
MVAPDFLAMLDVTEANMYIIYMDRCRQGRNPTKHPMNHLQFKNTLCEGLLQGWW